MSLSLLKLLMKAHHFSAAALILRVSASTAHSLDLQLRRMLADAVASMDGAARKADAARQLNAERKQLLARCCSAVAEDRLLYGPAVMSECVCFTEPSIAAGENIFAALAVCHAPGTSTSQRIAGDCEHDLLQSDSACTDDVVLCRVGRGEKITPSEEALQGILQAFRELCNRTGRDVTDVA